MTEPSAVESGQGRVTVEFRDAMAILTLDRPGKRNAVTLPMWQQISQIMAELGDSQQSSVVVLRGAGTVFSAGGDLSEVLAATQSEQAATFYCHTVVTALRALAGSALPSIAAINGVASGGGVELALATDLRLAIGTATLQLPMSHLGVVPDTITFDRLVRAVGVNRANWMLLTGRAVKARVCYDIGLVDEIADDAATFESALDLLVRDVGRAAPLASRRSRRLLGGELPTVAAAAEPMVESFLTGEVARTAQRFLLKNKMPL